MATDVDVQYFSHLNGLVLNNNWGDMIRLLDACLVSGVELPDVTSASIDEQGDVHLTLFAPHKAMLLQVVELTGFEPVSLNQKYRIKGVPSDSQIILKPQSALTETIIAKKGVSKLASLGYDIVFRDVNDVKRVYRAKNPTAQHPFIRVDESISDGTNSYHSSYAKYAMVGLLEHMDHIDDFENPDVLQLPFDPANPAKNWRTEGTGANVIRGWLKWYWARSSSPNNSSADTTAPGNGGRIFTIIGDTDAFYYLSGSTPVDNYKNLRGIGLFDSCLPSDVVPNWFAMGVLSLKKASDSTNGSSTSNVGVFPLGYGAGNHALLPKYTISTNSPHVTAQPETYRNVFTTGRVDQFAASDVAALSVPLIDTDRYLRGNLKHICYAGKNITDYAQLTPIISGGDMYLVDHIFADGRGGVYFYLGELD